MWSPLFCPSLIQAVTAFWLDLEDNHPEIMTQCWSRRWLAELLPAAAQHDVAPCPCLLFFYTCTCVDMSASVLMCQHGCEGVTQNSITNARFWLLHSGSWCAYCCYMNDEIWIAPKSETLTESVCVCVYVFVCVFVLHTHVEAFEWAWGGCLYLYSQPEGCKMTCLLWLNLW